MTAPIPRLSEPSLVDFTGLDTNRRRPDKEPVSPANPRAGLARRDLLCGIAALASGWGCAPANNTRQPQAPKTGGTRAQLDGFCDGLPPVDNAERAQRRARFQAEMALQGIDLFVMEAGTQMRFLTGVRWGQSERPVLLVLPVQGSAFFVAPHFEARKLQAKLDKLDERSFAVHTWREHESVAQVLGKVIGSATAKISVDPWMRTFVSTPVLALSPSPVDGQALVVRTRACKTHVELQRLRRANEATKAAIHHVAGQLSFGVRQSEFAKRLHDAQARAGLSDIWVLALFGPNASFPHGTAEDRALQPGDVVLVDTGGALHGYQSDVSRTFALGPVAKDIERAVAAVLKAQSAAIDQVAPGRVAGDLDAAARSVLRDQGYGGSDRWFTHRLGHGIGVEVHEAPYLVAGSPQVLETGMTFSVEPGIYVPGRFGVRIEDIVAVSPNGVDVMGTRTTLDAFYRS